MLSVLVGRYDLKPFCCVAPHARVCVYVCVCLGQSRHSDRRQVLCAKRIQPGTDAAVVLREGDIILAVDSVPVACFRDVEAAVVSKEEVVLTVLRECEVLGVTVKTDPVCGDGTGRFVGWAGALLQEVSMWPLVCRCSRLL
jgi:hypothetical protein